MNEHLIIKEQPNGYVRITAEPGYSLYSIALSHKVSEAVVLPSQVNDFKAIVNE